MLFRSFTKLTKDRGIVTEAVLLRKIGLPAIVANAIQEKLRREQEAEQMKFVLQKEQQEAERKRVEAQGIADYQRVISQSLTDRQLQYEQIKAQLELAKSPNAKIIIMGKGNTPVILDGK